MASWVFSAAFESSHPVSRSSTYISVVSDKQGLVLVVSAARICRGRIEWKDEKVMPYVTRVLRQVSIASEFALFHNKWW